MAAGTVVLVVVVVVREVPVDDPVELSVPAPLLNLQTSSPVGSKVDFQRAFVLNVYGVHF